MNREEYKAAIDSIPFSPDFQARTRLAGRVSKALEASKAEASVPLAWLAR